MVHYSQTPIPIVFQARYFSENSYVPKLLPPPPKKGIYVQESNYYIFYSHSIILSCLIQCRYEVNTAEWSPLGNVRGILLFLSHWINITNKIIL